MIKPWHKQRLLNIKFSYVENRRVVAFSMANDRVSFVNPPE